MLLYRRTTTRICLNNWKDGSETVKAPSQLKLTENIMADNMEENGLSLIIDDGEAYPAYRISLNKITVFLNCEENCSWKILVVVFLSSYIINL